MSLSDYYSDVFLNILFHLSIFERARLAFISQVSHVLLQCNNRKEAALPKGCPSLSCHPARRWCGGRFSTSPSTTKTHLLYLEQSTVPVNMPVTALCSRLSKQIRQEGKLCWGTHAIALHEKHRRLCQAHHMGGILAF